MLIERKEARAFWVRAVLNSTPDLAIAAVIALIADEGFLLFFGVLIGLQAVYFVIWLKKSIWIWISYAVRDRKLLEQRVLDMLIENKFPKPPELLSDVENYLNEVAGETTADDAIRLTAAAEWGGIQYALKTMRFQEYFRLTMVYEAAIEEYNRQINAL